MTKFDEIKNAVRKNKECLLKTVGIAGGAIVLMSAELAGEIKVIEKICDGVDEDNPASFGQIVGTVATSIVGTLAMYGTGIAAADMAIIALDDWDYSKEDSEED